MKPGTIAIPPETKLETPEQNRKKTTINDSTRVIEKGPERRRNGEKN